MKISEKDFNFIIYGSYYIDYCFSSFLLQQPKSKVKQRLCRACTGGLKNDNVLLDILTSKLE
jgi:hypothetical protein